MLLQWAFTENMLINIALQSDGVLLYIGCLNRHHFNRTSSGKSTVVNAMIGINLMSCGMGHTTSCFVQIEESRKSGGTAIDHDLNARSRRGLSTFLDGHSYYAIRKPNARGDETVLACCAMIDEVVPLEIEV